MSDIAIDGGWICDTAETRIGAVLVSDGVIAAVAWTDEDRAALRARAGSVVDASGHWLMPGLMDAHAHAYGTLLRGTENSQPLEVWALYTTLYGRAFDADAILAAILLGAAERIRGGITGTVDHSPMMKLGHAALAAHEASGLRVAYAPFLHDVSDYDLLDLPLPAAMHPLVSGPPALDADVFRQEFASLVQAARAGSGRVRVQLGPNAPQRCSPAAWALWRELRDRHDVAVHTHLLETQAQASLNARWPGGMVAAMAREGMLEGRLTCAHGVWLNDAERAVLARHDVTVSHNPVSNLMLGSGVLNWGGCVACGLRVALGSDSANTGGRHDLFGVMRMAAMVHRAPGSDFTTWPTLASMFARATEGGAAALGLKERVGRVAEGQLADLVLVRASAAGTLAAEPALDVLVQHAGPEHVDSVMVRGEWVMRAGTILAFDEVAVLADAQVQAKAIRKRVTATLPVLRSAMPEITAQFLQARGRFSCT